MSIQQVELRTGAEMPGQLEDLIRDSSVVEELIRPGNRKIMVIGGTDTGKTTMIECLIDLLSKEGNVGIVDLDMGQSHVGPPTTVAWGEVRGGFRGWSQVAMEEFYFTGAVSPVRSLLPAIVGAKLMTDRAASSCGKIVIDTSGMISGPLGRILKQSKIDILAPDMIPALQCSGELGHIIDPFYENVMPKIYIFPVSPTMRSKSIPMRGQYRFESMTSYFASSDIREVPINLAVMRFTSEPSGRSVIDLTDRVISFRDRYNRDLALGIIEEIRMKEEMFMIRTPLTRDADFSAIIVGKTRIDMMNSMLVDEVIDRTCERDHE
jgi:polynucleotide 5'-hydroxyl-kinase GRC3/NOL9